MNQFAPKDGLAARRKIIYITSFFFLMFAAGFGNLLAQTDENTKEKPDQTSPTTTNKVIDKNEISEPGLYPQQPLVLRKDLIMPYSYRPRDNDVPDFMKLEQLKYPIPLRDPGPATDDSKTNKDLLSSTPEDEDQ